MDARLAPACRARHRPSPGMPAAIRRRDDEDRAAAETLRRCPVAEDQLADGPAAARVAIVEHVGDAAERPPGDGDLDHRVDEEVAGPGAVRRAGGDEDRSVRLLDEPDRDRAGGAAQPAAGPEMGEARVVGERGIEVGNAIGAPGGTARRAARRPGGRAGPPGRAVDIVGGRQRLRCQDLPSVATDGA
jgi:hypothetical protein